MRDLVGYAGKIFERDVEVHDRGLSRAKLMRIVIRAQTGRGLRQGIKLRGNIPIVRCEHVVYPNYLIVMSRIDYLNGVEPHGAIGRVRKEQLDRVGKEHLVSKVYPAVGSHYRVD